MHKLVEYACEELEKLEKKAERGSMTMAEIEYADKLASLKKNLLKGEKLYDEMDEEYSGAMMDGRTAYAGGRSYARGRGGNARRDSMGRYSRDGGVIEQLRDLMEDAPDEQTRRELEKLVRKMESM